MKSLLLTALPTNPRVKNIGDYIQACAVRQFAPSVDGYIDREATDSYTGENGRRAKVVLNGCFLFQPSHWPPAESIIPLYTSMHIYPFVEKEFFSEATIEHLKKHAPIGCRDKGTERMLHQYGIPCYYSSCLTLTLGKTYRNKGNQSRVLFVDPFIPDLHYRRFINGRLQIDWKALSRCAVTILRHPLLTWRLARDQFFQGYGNQWGHRTGNTLRHKLITLSYVVQFIRLYSSKCSASMLKRAKYISNMYRLKEEERNNEKLMKVAEKYLRMYEEASLVITSRIHAALPCLAMETPVIFILHEVMESPDIQFNTPGRYEGILDFFRIMRVDGAGLHTTDEVLQACRGLTSDTTFSNKRDWVPFAEKLAAQADAFFRD